MASCLCGRSYQESYGADGSCLGLCPKCIQASNGGGYLSSKEWTCGHVVDSSDNTREAEE